MFRNEGRYNILLPLGVDRRRNQNPEYNWKIRIQSEYQNTIGNPEYKRNIRMQSENQNTIGKPEYNRKIRTQSEIHNTIEKLEYISENRTTYKKIKTGETQKHQNTKEKGDAADAHIVCENNIWRR